MTCWAGVAQHLDQMVNHWYDTPEIQNGQCSVFCGHSTNDLRHEPRTQPLPPLTAED